MDKVMKHLLLAAALGMAMAAGAQNLDRSAEDRTSTFEAPGKPARGMSQDAVEANFGSPQSVRDAIGDPPITRWEYAEFVVFFEYDKVIHAVSKR